MNNKLYSVYRMYQDGRKPRRMRKDLTLKQAQEHCNDPNTSSRTKGNPGKLRLARMDLKQAHWFDGYREQ